MKTSRRVRFGGGTTVPLHGAGSVGRWARAARAVAVSALVLASSALAGSGEHPGAFSGLVENDPQWFDPSDPSRAAEALGRETRVNGWMLFGADGSDNAFSDTSNRLESLPTYVAAVAVARGTRVARFAGYTPIPAPNGRGELMGTLTLQGLEGDTELIVVRFGAGAPPVVRLAVLVDNLGSPDYAARGLSLAVDGADGPASALSPDGKPDWVFWDLRGLKDGSAVSLRVQPDKGVAAVGGLLFLSAAAHAPREPGRAGPLPLIDHKVGEFSREGEYIKDYFVYRDGETFHLFYNVGNAGESQQWFEAGNEKAFGHATSKDLARWEHHPRVLPVMPGTWEGMVVSAPSIIKHGGTYYMFYTGFDDRVPGKQTVGLATSKDLFGWERHPRNPIYEAPAWAERRPDGWVDCRDSHVVRFGGEFLLFTTVSMGEGKGAIALASSQNLLDWKDLGPAVTTFKEPESPRVFEHGGSFYMFISSAFGKQLLRAANPKAGPWEEVPFRWPAPGLWSGWETVDVGGRTVFSAFEWKSFGNHIRFWDVRWNSGVPEVRY
jgi:hypothetical protein